MAQARSGRTCPFANRVRRRACLCRIRAVGRRSASLPHAATARIRPDLPIGLYLDLAVGVRPDGFDAWYDQDFYLPNIEIGAPPDALNTARPALGSGRRQSGQADRVRLRAVPSGSARVDAICRRDPARSRSGIETALSGSKRRAGRSRRLCPISVRAVAGGRRGRERDEQMHRHRRGPRDGAAGFSRNARRLGSLVVPCDVVRTRRRRRLHCA